MHRRNTLLVVVSPVADPQEQNAEVAEPLVTWIRTQAVRNKGQRSGRGEAANFIAAYKDSLTHV